MHLHERFPLSLYRQIFNKIVVVEVCGRGESAQLTTVPIVFQNSYRPHFPSLIRIDDGVTFEAWLGICGYEAP